MTSAITETTTEDAFSVSSAVSEPSRFSSMITSMLLPLFIPTSALIQAPAPAATAAPAAAASLVQPFVPCLLSSCAADSYTVPKGTLMTAVVNINIDLESLPFTDAALNTSYSFSQYHQLFEAMTGISITGSADYIMESFYYYYYHYNSYDIADEDDMHDSDDDRNGSIIDTHDESNNPAMSVSEDEKYVNSFYEQITWFVELEGGRTRLISILHVDLGSDIPHWVAEMGLAANAIQSIISLRNLLLEKDLTQEYVSMSESLSDDDL